MSLGNPLIEEDINRLLLKLAIPGAIGFFSHTAFNLTDTFFAGRVSAAALTGLSASFPLFFLLVALGAGFGSGAGSLVGNMLGSGDKALARKYSAQTILLALLLAILVLCLKQVAIDLVIPLVIREPEVLKEAHKYISVIYWGALPIIFINVLGPLLTVCGDTRSVRNFLVCGALANTLLNPFFIWIFPGFDLGAIALATVLVEVAGSIYYAKKLIQYEVLDFKSLTLIPDGPIMGSIFRYGISSAISMASIAIGSFIIVRFAGKFDHSTVGAYGLATRIEQVFLLPILGMNMALRAIISQNFGAGRLDRANAAFNNSVIASLALTISSSLLIFFFGEYLTAFFTSDKAIQLGAAGYLGYSRYTLPAYALVFLSNATTQSCRKPEIPMGISIFRQIAAPLLFYPYLCQFGADGLWLGISLVNWVAGLGACLIARHILLNYHR
ncbi:MAG: MATE family efflux transporter [bacterium]|nr:MATE family efflux transporter [bacterium]